MQHSLTPLRWRSLCVGILLGLAAWAIPPGLVQAQTPASASTVAVGTELRASPALNGKVVQRLEPGATLQRLSTQGGWVRVRSNGQEGWVRATHLRAAGAPAAAGKSGGGVASGLAGLFTAASSSPTATTGTRGMQQQELANATPNPAEVSRLDRYATSPAQARQFARNGKLQARTIAEEQ